MKRKIAARRLQRVCLHCSCNFKKGDVYYKKRVVSFDSESWGAFEYLICAKCKYKNEQREQRFYQFMDKCRHPITKETYSYIPGECVMQPEGKECVLCYQRVT